MSREPTLSQTSYDTYSAQFLTRDFVSLIEDMEEIEIQIQQDLHLALLSLLASEGAEIRGDVIEVGGVFYKLLISSPLGGRSLNIVLGAISGGQQLTGTEVRIDGFGLIQDVLLEFPHKLDRLQRLTQEVVSRQYLRAYTALEAAYIETYGRWVATLFSTAYGIVNTELLIRGSSQLAERFWFSVTDLDRMTFRYHFSRDNLASTVAWLRENQDRFISPCAAATLLITEDAADGVIGVPEPSKTTRYDESTLIVEFAALPTLGVNTAFWIAERTLFENDALAAIHIDEIDDRAIELNCAADSVGVFVDVINGCREDLTSVVGASYDDFKREQRKLREAVERARNSVSWMRVAGTDFAAKVVAELIKQT